MQTLCSWPLFVILNFSTITWIYFSRLHGFSNIVPYLSFTFLSIWRILWGGVSDPRSPSRALSELGLQGWDFWGLHGMHPLAVGGFSFPVAFAFFNQECFKHIFESLCIFDVKYVIRFLNTGRAIHLLNACDWLACLLVLIPFLFFMLIFCPMLIKF